jgi:hypothetical protein
MSIWNRIGDLTKGTLDWVGDVGLGVLAIPRLAWDLGTAPWNDREEYDTFLGSVKQAGLDFGKNVGRPIGGVLAAVEATNRNLIREPLSAVTLFAQRNGDMGISDSWKKAWEARNEISFGQALTTQFGQSLGQFLPDDLTPKFMDSDFDIYDDKQRESAFNESLMGKGLSGTVDTITQFAGDVSIIGGKFVAAKRAADSAKDAILAIREVRAGIPTENPLAKKYDLLAEDFAKNDIAWAQNHPWVKGSNNEATTSYLLGITATKEEALNTMLAVMGDNSGIDILKELKRPDIVEPLRIANGEISRSDYKILLNEEAKIINATTDDMLQFAMRTPDEIQADRDFISAWAKHDRYVDTLLNIAETPAMTEGISATGRGTGAFMASAKSSLYHAKEIGDAKLSMYQPTPFHKLYYTVTWPMRERPSGVINLNEGESIREITAVTDRLIKLSKPISSKPAAFITRTQSGTFTPADAMTYIERYAAAGTPEARALIVNELEQTGYRIVAAKNGVSPERAEELFNYHVKLRTGKMNESKEEGFMFDKELNQMIKVPLFESQTANFLPIADFDTIDAVIKRNANAIRAVSGNVHDLIAATSDLWKAAVLLRLGYPIRNAVDSQLRIWATVGAMTSLRHLGEGAKDLWGNSRAATQRMVDNYDAPAKLDYKTVKDELQKNGAEATRLTKEVADIETRLAMDPTNPDLVGQLVTKRKSLQTVNAVYESNNATLTRLEQAKVASRKKRIGEKDIELESTIDGVKSKDWRDRFNLNSTVNGADGTKYTAYGSFGGPNGGLFRELNSSQKTFYSLMEDYSTIYGTGVASKGRGAVRPGDVNYYQEWTNAINETFANAAVPRGLMAGKSVDEVAKELADNPQLRARLNVPRDGALEYVVTAQKFLDDYVPDGYGIREKIMSALPGDEAGKVTEDFLRNAIRDPNALPIVHGHLLDANMNLTLRGISNRFTSTLFKYLATIPEDNFARHPLFIDLYEKSMQKRLETAEFLKGGTFTRQEFADIQYNLTAGARADAMKGVKAVLYNVERRSNAAHMLRFISPFFSAQENAVKTWFKIAADKPQMLNRANVVWNAPERSGLITDENGDPVAPGQALSTNDTMWLPIPNVLKRLPVIGEGLTSLDTVGISKRSLDVIFQGNPFGVSVGPFAAIPVANVLKLKPELSEIVSFAFPYGPDASLNQFMPTWMRNTLKGIQGLNNDDYAKTYQLIWLTEQQKAQEARTPYLTDGEIKKKTDAFYKMRVAANLILPFAPQFESPYRLWMDKWREYSKNYGLAADAKFLEDFPEYFEFATSLSKNPTGSQATMDDVQNAKRYTDLISDVVDDNSYLVGLITRGSGAAKYNPTAYWWQSETAIAPGTPERYRSKQDPKEAQRANAAREGWAKYRRAMVILDAHLEKRGLTSFQQSGAEDLAYAKQVVIQQLASDVDPVTGQPTGQPSAWYEDYRDIDGTKSAKTMSGFKKIISNEKFMADNGDDPTWKSVAVYMKIRDSIASLLGARESSNIDSKQNEDLRMALDYYVNQLKAGDLEFANIYDRFLSQDRIYDKYLGSGI